MLRCLANSAVEYISCHAKKVLNQLSAAAILLILMSVIGSVHAQARYTQRYDYRIVTTDDTDATRSIVEDLQKKIPSAQVVPDSLIRPTKTKSAISIAIGPLAFRSLLAQGGEGVIVSLFTSSQAYHAIVESMVMPRRTSVTAIYAEPSPLLQLRLVSMLHKKPARVAAILSSKTSYLEPMLRHMASQSGTELSIEYFGKGETLNRVLNRVSDIPFILAMPDSTIYNAENIRNILLTAYRRNQSVIGFSASLVKAGALASVYSDIEDINAQLGEMIAEYESSGKLAEPQFPKYFGTIVNEDVAQSLNIIIDDATKRFSRTPALSQP